ASSGDAAARLPMPVRWIYVLRDGTLTVPSGGSGTTAVFAAPEPVPTTANPIVGRIAFWTDDETCKLNINTACGGVPWDTPIGNSGLEMLFARYQPAKNEFARYPGHPASVSLAPVLWSFLGMASPSDTVFPSFTPNWNTTLPMSAGPALSPAATAFRDKLFPLIPRNTFGGSKMATVPTVDVLSGAAALSAVDSDRLFASADEILYGPDEASSQRDANPLGIGAADAGKLRFFLTAQSRAPEVNLFNLPKICLWPLPDATRKSEANANALASDTRSPVDRLIAFCSTLAYDNATKKREYAFTRYDATSASNDFNATDAFGSGNNQVLYSYLEGLMARPIPGFGGTLSARYGVGGSRQILGGIYDYIRSQINVLDTSYSASDPASAQNVDGAFVSRYAYAGSVGDSLALGGLTGLVGQVIPASLPNGIRGGGRFPVVSQVTLEFIAQAANQPPVSGNPMHPWLPSGDPYPTIDLDSDSPASAYDSSRPTKFHTHPGLRFLTLPSTAGGTVFDVPNPRYRGPNLAEYQTQIEPVFLLSFSIPGAGVPGYRNPFRVRVRGLQNLRVGGVAIFNSYDTQITTVNPGSQVWQFHLSPSNWPTASALIGNPFVVGSPADSGQTFSFDGGSVSIELLNAKDNSVVQTYNLAFPPAVFPTPMLPHALPSDSRARTEHSFWSAAGTKPAFPPVKAADLPPSSLLTFSASSALSTTPNYPGGVSGYAAGKTRLLGGSALGNLVLPQWPVNNDYRGKLSSDTVRSLEVAFGDARMITQLGVVPSSFFLPHRFYFDAKMRAAHSLRSFQYETQFDQLQGATLQYLTASSAVPSANLPSYGGGWNAGDPNPGNLWNVATGQDVQRLAYNYFVAGNNAAKGDKWPFTSSATEFEAAKFAAYKNSDPSLSGIPDFPTLWSRGADFTSGIPGLMDGAMLGKVDEGNNRTSFAGNNRGMYPYFNELASTAIVPVGPNLFSPNRQVPSAVVLGSVPAGYSSAFDPANPSLSAVTPWRTLLFAPNPVGTSHGALAEVSTGGALPQAGKAPDFTILDFFWMPVVEPYAISEPLSTAGKVNMNAQIAPFTYITRETALRGVFRSTLITAIPDKWINSKNSTGSGSGILTDLGGSSASINYANFRYPINAEETLK
ncbi:MAG TPA: Verru_Chthon cassette protein A, partial [Terrimicrobiaceae bacterium]|nr:Verru_Chthon cassette protein A [Terrimicrobiaceae bacterium]